MLPFFRRCSRRSYSAASFSFFSGRTFTLTDAGLAANHCSWPVNGFLPKPFFVAGTWIAETLNSRGSANSPAPFLWMALTIVFSR